MAINAIADLQDGVQAQGATYLLAQRHRKTPSMLRVTSFRWQNDTPLLLWLQLCSNHDSNVRSRHEHRPLHSLLGVWGLFLPIFIHALLSLTVSKAISEIRVSSSDANQACAAQSEPKPVQSPEAPKASLA